MVGSARYEGRKSGQKARKMSNTDGFIEEVTEEVRRDHLYGLLRRYGWIAIAVILLIVGGASYSEYRKAQEQSKAEGLGDAMLAALALNEDAERAEALSGIEPSTSSSAAILRMLTAGSQADAGDTAAAVETLNALAIDGEVPEIYRQLAQFKAITLQGTDTPVEDRRQALEVMAQPGSGLRLLATEQLALTDIEMGEPQAAIDRYQAILADAEVTSDLQQRALQVIVALGGEPDLSDVNTLSQRGTSLQEN